MKCLAPGIYDDGAGGLHLVCDELLAAHGWPDNEHNREALLHAAQQIFGAAVVIASDEPRTPQ